MVYYDNKQYFNNNPKNSRYLTRLDAYLFRTQKFKK